MSSWIRAHNCFYISSILHLDRFYNYRFYISTILQFGQTPSTGNNWRPKRANWEDRARIWKWSATPQHWLWLKLQIFERDLRQEEGGEAGVHQVDPEVGARGVVLPPRVEERGTQPLPLSVLLKQGKVKMNKRVKTKWSYSIDTGNINLSANFSTQNLHHFRRIGFNQAD